MSTARRHAGAPKAASEVAVLIPSLFLVAALAGVLPDCRCGCVNGAAMTLCTSIDAAQAQHDLCPSDLRCPSPGEAAELQRLDAPDPAATDCRRTMVWSVAEADYVPRNLCDVLASDP